MRVLFLQISQKASHDGCGILLVNAYSKVYSTNIQKCILVLHKLEASSTVKVGPNCTTCGANKCQSDRKNAG